MPYLDKAKQAANAKGHYERNKAAVKKRAREHSIRTRKVLRKYVQEVLSGSKCVDCGITDPRVLEFDHVRGEKEREISKMVCNSVSLEKLKQEMAKCEVRCCNCHRIRTRVTSWAV